MCVEIINNNDISDFIGNIGVVHLVIMFTTDNFHKQIADTGENTDKMVQK